MTALRLTALLGPREVVEAAELRMGALPHTLAMAVPFDSWNEAAGGNVLPVAMAKVAEMFAAGIKRGEHLAEPEPFVIDAAPDEFPPMEPGAVVHASAEPSTADGPLYHDVLIELLGQEAWQEWIEASDKARRIVALVERRAA